MPVLILIELEGATPAQHDEVEELLGTGPDNPPPGLISHTAAVSDTGLVIADVWGSRWAMRSGSSRRSAPRSGRSASHRPSRRSRRCTTT